MIIVDASVALKWVVPEEGSDRARGLLEHEVLAAPDLMWTECANVLWVKARRGQITRETAMAALAAIDAAPIRCLSARDYSKAAQTIAFELDQTAYDCFYLATSLAERAILVTADEAFARAAMAHPVYRASIRAL
ncbi:MAG: type II toxin-antitoxin system VapC family toxin [Hyphomicrobiaceae bacterium]